MRMSWSCEKMVIVNNNLRAPVIRKQQRVTNKRSDKQYRTLKRRLHSKPCPVYRLAPLPRLRLATWDSPRGPREPVIYLSAHRLRHSGLSGTLALRHSGPASDPRSARPATIPDARLSLREPVILTRTRLTLVPVALICSSIREFDRFRKSAEPFDIFPQSKYNLYFKHLFIFLCGIWQGCLRFRLRFLIWKLS